MVCPRCERPVPPRPGFVGVLTSHVCWSVEVSPAARRAFGAITTYQDLQVLAHATAEFDDELLEDAGDDHDLDPEVADALAHPAVPDPAGWSGECAGYWLGRARAEGVRW